MNTEVRPNTVALGALAFTILAWRTANALVRALSLAGGPLDTLVTGRRIEWHYIASGTPQGNAFIESFDARLRS